jgi:hypothetical protein
VNQAKFVHAKIHGGFFNYIAAAFWWDFSLAYTVPVPAKEKATLTEAVKTNYTIRQKLIDTVLRLDASTVPAV